MPHEPTTQTLIDQPLDFAFLRAQTVGTDAAIRTPLGERLMVYCDYTASGRCLRFVETYLQNLQRVYANTHTEDDLTGRSMTRLLHQAERIIKDHLNAGPTGRLIACGTGATGAIEKLQQILGIALPPATRERARGALGRFMGAGMAEEFERFLGDHQPVVFVGPYEHHSNEISWRQGLATVVEVGLAPDGSVDLADLERLLREPAYRGRLRVGSFSAASNVTGMRSPVHEIARLLHRHDALACFDYAACAPYVPIDMNPPHDPASGDPSLDAVFISAHKFLGGPGASGILVFNERLYRRDLPPTFAGGGTVDYVNADAEDFIADIEEREKAGTPGVLQTIKAAMAFEVKRLVGCENIEARERALLGRALGRWQANPRIEILGNPDPERRIAVVSFNVRDEAGRYLHPKLVTALLNDLFGIQSRAGCSCAGPYGHRLLGIDAGLSARYRHWICAGFGGIKPGWCRVGFHYVMDDAEAAYVIDAVDFVASHGALFVPVYDFDLATGAWTHREQSETRYQLSLTEALRTRGEEPERLSATERSARYRRYFREAQTLAAELARATPRPERRLDGELGELQFFNLR